MIYEFIKNGQYYKIKDMKEIDPNAEFTPIFDGDQLRKVVLRSNPKENYFIDALKRVTTGQMQREKGKDRGHLIADVFQDFLLTKREIEEHKAEVNRFFGKGNNDNVRPQSADSNRNSKKKAGQLRFEQKVYDYLKKSENRELYFEIEECELDNKLGRRIFIRFLDSDIDDIHVFIPDVR